MSQENIPTTLTFAFGDCVLVMVFYRFVFHSLFAVLIDIGKCFMVDCSMTGAKHNVARSHPCCVRLLYDTSNSTLLSFGNLAKI